MPIFWSGVITPFPQACPPEREPQKNIDWLTILNKSKLDKTQEWIIFFKDIVELAETQGDIGFLEKAKYLPTLIEKVYNNKV